PTSIYGRVRDTEAMKRSVEELILLGGPSQEAIDRALLLAEGVEFGRTLANRASNDLFPERMADVARQLEADGCTVEVLGPPLMVVAPMVEKRPGGNAQRPGDVVKAMNGKTVEVNNTDAEGRLILIDALHWAEREGATHLIDIATLTGAAAVAFGELISPYFARPRDWGTSVQSAGDATGEWLWEMPLATEYRTSLDSAYADIMNTGTREGSLIKSAVFIHDFVTVPWVHMDIAG